MKHVLGPIALGAVMVVIVGCGGSPSTSSSSSAATAASLSTSATSSPVGQPSSAAATASPSQTASASSPTNTGDPCRLLTAAEAEAALGRAVGAPVKREFPGSSGTGFDCAYNSVNQDAGPASVHAGLLGNTVPRSEWEQAERQQADLQEVAGVGELAFFDKYHQTIDVFDHGRWVQVQMINSTRFSELLALLTDMARNAVERI